MMRSVPALSLLLAIAAPASAQDWSNYGGNNARNGRSPVEGPTAVDPLWSNTTDFSIIAWHPFIHDGRVFAIREAGFPQNGGAANDALVAYDLATGAELWRVTLPFNGNTSQEWIAWIGGARDGKVYASRSTNLQPGPIQAFDAATGALQWTSALSTEAWAHDGVVFAPDGDLIVGDRLIIARIDQQTGATVWATPRGCSVSGNCGGAATADAVYIDEPAPGGQVLTRIDMVTGARLYSSPVMQGFTDQNSPFVSIDGSTVYLSRTQDNPTVDFLYAFQDTGSQFVERWHVPVRWTTSHEFGLAADGDIYTFLPDNQFVRLEAATGAVVATAGVLAPIGTSNLSPKTAVGADGVVYVSNGWASSPASDGRLWAFTPDLDQELMVVPLDRQNAGGPALGGDGVLVMADRQGVFAWRTPTWPDLGFAKPGVTGDPLLEGKGSLVAQTLGEITLTNARPNTTALLITGLTNLSTPFLGGTLVPSPDLVFSLPTDFLGTIPITFTTPAAVLSGVTLYFQYWIADPAATLGVAASNAVTVTTP